GRMLVRERQSGTAGHHGDIRHLSATGDAARDDFDALAINIAVVHRAAGTDDSAAEDASAAGDAARRHQLRATLLDGRVVAGAAEEVDRAPSAADGMADTPARQHDDRAAAQHRIADIRLARRDEISLAAANDCHAATPTGTPSRAAIGSGRA